MSTNKKTKRPFQHWILFPVVNDGSVTRKQLHAHLDLVLDGLEVATQEFNLDIVKAALAIYNGEYPEKFRLVSTKLFGTPKYEGTIRNAYYRLQELKEKGKA